MDYSDKLNEAMTTGDVGRGLLYAQLKVLDHIKQEPRKYSKKERNAVEKNTNTILFQIYENRVPYEEVELLKRKLFQVLMWMEDGTEWS